MSLILEKHSDHKENTFSVIFPRKLVDAGVIIGYIRLDLLHSQFVKITGIFKKLLLAYGEDINIFVFDSKAPNWDNFQALTSSSSVTTRQCSNTFSMHSLLRQFLDGEVRYLSLKKVCPNEAQELFDAAKKAAQHRYATYVRMSKIDYSAE